jgi:hypothetical protein
MMVECYNILIGNFFQVSIKSLYSGLKMIALQSKYITDQ